MLSRRWLAVSFLLAACSTRTSSPPREIGATPGAPPAVSAWDPSSLPRTVAVTDADGALTLARVTTASVEVVATVPSPGRDRGWLDARTLVGLAERTGGGFVVTSLVDGKAGDVQVVTPAEWPAFAAELVLGDGEVWLTGCKTAVEYTDCAQPTAIRVAPGPRLVAAEAPAGRRRYGYHGAHLLAAPSGTAPAGITARLDEVRDGAALDPAKTIASCAGPDGERRLSVADLFGAPLELDVYHFDAPQLRWLATSPPLLEVSFRYTDPVEITRTARHVMRPCGRPFVDFRWLGDGVWAERAGNRDEPGAWIFHRGDVTLGELRGDALD